MQSNKG